MMPPRARPTFAREKPRISKGTFVGSGVGGVGGLAVHV